MRAKPKAEFSLIKIKPSTLTPTASKSSSSQPRTDSAFRLREWRRPIILLRCAWSGCYGSAPKISPLPFLLANAHVASCGWLGIHEAHHEAFGFEILDLRFCSPLRKRHDGGFLDSCCHSDEFINIVTNTRIYADKLSVGGIDFHRSKHASICSRTMERASRRWVPPIKSSS